MAESGTLSVSHRGQMSLPADTRRRWGLADDGGPVTYLDVGDAIVLIPGRIGHHRAALLDQLTEEDWADGHAGFGDPELATE